MVVSRKICILGDPSVGKTSLIKRYVLSMFDDKYITTLGANIYRKTIISGGDGDDIMLVLWDVCGQKDYRLTHDSAITHSKGFIFVCDLTRPETWRSLKDYWIDKAQGIAGNVPAVILANKKDLLRDDQIDEDAVLEAVGDCKINIIFSSAKKDEGVKDAFEMLTRLLAKGTG